VKVRVKCNFFKKFGVPHVQHSGWIHSNVNFRVTLNVLKWKDLLQKNNDSYL
jgi:hypothetical protein